MKRVFKSQPPNALTHYAQKHPHADWDNDFRNHSVSPDKPGDDYKKIKALLVYCPKNERWQIQGETGGEMVYQPLAQLFYHATYFAGERC